MNKNAKKNLPTQEQAAAKYDRLPAAVKKSLEKEFGELMAKAMWVAFAVLNGFTEAGERL